ncbi:hypothetical protein CL617_04905 [archaeon]|nr:hypothetical protein [archaeon]|tara:strand:- start:4174 stop:5424 length:1251 start_codon:yes stop_codon:yes gene_type:complete
MVTKKQRKINYTIIGIVGFFLISILIFLSFGLQQKTVSFSNQCLLPSCDTGYKDAGTICIDLTCTRVCQKDIFGCGDYGRLKTETKSHLVTPDDRNTYKKSGSVTESSNLCYKFATATTFSVTDRKAGLFSSPSTAHEVYSREVSGLVSTDPTCSSSSSISSETSFSNGKKGDSSVRRAEGKYIGYKGATTCRAGRNSDGSEGNLQVSLIYQTAPWKVIDKETTEINCNYDCDTNRDCGSTQSGQPFCDGNNIVRETTSPICSNNNKCSTSTDTTIVESCDSGCSGSTCIIKEDDGNGNGGPIDGEISIYRFSNNQCNQETIIVTQRTSMDYDTLNECKKNILIEEGCATLGIKADRDSCCIEEGFDLYNENLSQCIVDKKIEKNILQIVITWVILIIIFILLMFNLYNIIKRKRR